MTQSLSGKELRSLIERVFSPTPEQRTIAVFADLPDAKLEDTPAWKDRRALALEWVKALASTDLQPSLVLYRNARANNADLPQNAWSFTADQVMDWDSIPQSADDLEPSSSQPFAHWFKGVDMILAPTQLSTTAPLKVAAPDHGFKAATMPGFSRDMIPSLRLDYQEINRRVLLLKKLLDKATHANFVFTVGETAHQLTLDLRQRTAHASGGLIPDVGMAGNLPSGEAYIVPYEGELENTTSRSSGVLPVQFEQEVVLYEIKENRAVAVLNSDNSSKAAEEASRLQAEPAYGNLAELGLGVLEAFGVEPTGEILLDEKLGLHIAFGRSNHFGGQVGPAQFSSPEAVVHIDRVYIPQLQPKVRVTSVDLQMDDGSKIPLMRDQAYTVDFSSKAN